MWKPTRPGSRTWGRWRRPERRAECGSRQGRGGCRVRGRRRWRRPERRAQRRVSDLERRPHHNGVHRPVQVHHSRAGTSHEASERTNFVLHYVCYVFVFLIAGTIAVVGTTSARCGATLETGLPFVGNYDHRRQRMVPFADHARITQLVFIAAPSPSYRASPPLQSSTWTRQRIGA